MSDEFVHHVELELFSGPLDLLLHLLREQELEATEIPVAVICDRYLQSLEGLENVDIDAAGEFLVMASILMRLKARALLPREDQLLDEEELDPRFELVRQLIEYRRFKQVAEMLEELREGAGRRFDRGIHPELGEISPPGPGETDISGATVDTLFAAFTRLLRETRAGGDYVLLKDDTPMEAHLERLDTLLPPGRRVPFGGLFEAARGRGYMIGVFLALLEMMKQGRCDVTQKGEFGEILVEGREPPPGWEAPRAPGMSGRLSGDGDPSPA